MTGDCLGQLLGDRNENCYVQIINKCYSNVMRKRRDNETVKLALSRIVDEKGTFFEMV